MTLKIDMTLFLREHDIIWPNENDRARTYIYCTKKPCQRK